MKGILEFCDRFLTASALVFFWILAILTIGYFLPTAVALSRNHKNKAAIFLLDLLLGWTFIGWALALVWSFTNE